jgi:hypothetical protein
MKVYFLSSQPCILTLNGAYFGTTDTFERFLELSPKDNLFVEFTPENGLPIRFFLILSQFFAKYKGRGYKNALCPVYWTQGVVQS